MAIDCCQAGAETPFDTELLNACMDEVEYTYEQDMCTYKVFALNIFEERIAEIYSGDADESECCDAALLTTPFD